MTQGILSVDLSLASGQFWLELATADDFLLWIDRISEDLNRSAFNCFGILESRPVLISNLRVWENIVLPHWYHGAGDLSDAELALQTILQQAGLDVAAQSAMLAMLPDRLDVMQRRLVALLRLALQGARIWVIEEAWWRWWHDPLCAEWPLVKVLLQLPKPQVLLVIAAQPAPAGFECVTLVKSRDNEE
ncbi:hypothetical protein HQN60_14625 [Deefgea piscis]|uniref:Uncharacterized protein n=1 Tax=Deefgea piscis TaxID=2739061 RepID=A0A6M8SRP0_9NEIS|nr:hypothetical protein [Deefgea piscis]QKJ67855.1 hypothetical protein HQN60_14625 [Deefgea piscis]